MFIFVNFVNKMDLLCFIGVISLCTIAVRAQQSCRVTNTIQGVCQPPDTCLSELQTLQSQGIRPTVCSFSNQHRGARYTVCCPVTTKKLSTQRGISEAKCAEYMSVETEELESGFSYISVVGGVPANIGEFPHIAAIGWTQSKGIEWLCGGSLISLNYVLTAAHCTVDDNNKAPDIVRLGDIDLISDTDGSNEQDFKVSSIVRHPQYRFSQLYHDIALMKLDKNSVISSSVRPACISLKDYDEQDRVTAIGYGHTEFAGTPSNNLQKVTLTKYKHDECVKQFEPSRQMPNGIIKGQLCAADPFAEMDTCQGDSGGPLSVLDNTTHYILGITSFGKACAASTPSVYTRIAEYFSWIESVVW